jgi:hypothetical protein
LFFENIFNLTKSQQRSHNKTQNRSLSEERSISGTNFNQNGIVSIIIPAGILGEARANPLREILIEKKRLLTIKQFYSSPNIFPQIVEGQPLCIIKYEDTTPGQNFLYNGNIRSLTDLTSENHFLQIAFSFLRQLAPNFHFLVKTGGNAYAIPFLNSQNEVQILLAMLKYPKLSTGWKFDAHRELNLTDDMTSGVIGPRKTDYPVMEGKFMVHFGYSLKQPRYYLQHSGTYFQKREIFQKERIIWRNVSNIRLRRRMFVCLLPPNIPTVNSINYLLANSDRLDRLNSVYGDLPVLSHDCLLYLTGILGSLVVEFFLRFFSSNNNLNQYLILNVPIPFYNPQNPLHQRLVQYLELKTPIFHEWADQMVMTGKNFIVKQHLERLYWEDLAFLDALVLKIYKFDILEFQTLQVKFPLIDGLYFQKINQTLAKNDFH